VEGLRLDRDDNLEEEEEGETCTISLSELLSKCFDVILSLFGLERR
jgi:hypothetical protein